MSGGWKHAKHAEDVRSMEGLGGTLRSTEEAAIGICIDHVKCGAKAPVGFTGLIRMPLQVTAHPVQLPLPASPEEANPRNRRVTGGRIVFPFRPNFEDLDDVALDRISDIELRSKLFGRAAMLNEPLESGEVLCSLDIGEGHGCNSLSCAKPELLVPPNVGHERRP
jgi:hypothetical protein